MDNLDIDNDASVDKDTRAELNYLNVVKPQSYSFTQDEVSICGGSGNIEFEYKPDSTQQATSIAYEYRFNNSMKQDMAVSLKTIDETNVTLSYAYSDTKLERIEESTYPFEAQRIASNQTKYIYIVVTPTSESIPSTFQSSVVFYQGVAGEITYDIGGTTLSQTIVKGQLLDVVIEPEAEDGYYFDAWFEDAEFTTIASTKRTNGGKLYARFHNFPINSSEYITYSNGEYSVTADPSIANLIIPTLYNDGVNGKALVTSIGTSAFRGSTTLFDVDLPSTLTTIEAQAFYQCTSLASIDLSNCKNLINIDEKAFSYCALTIIDLSGCTSLSYIFDNAFGWNDLQDVKLPNSLKTLGNYCFRTNYTLSSVTLPSNLTTIGYGAFYECVQLKSIVIPKSVTSIDSNPFPSCLRLTSIVVEDANSVYDSRDNCNAIIETASNKLISGCSTTVIPSGVVTIGSFAFHNSSIASVVLPEGVTTIEDWAFEYCDATSVILPSTLTTIGVRAFQECVSINTINFEDLVNLTTIGGYAFYNCNALEKVNLLNCDKLTTIGEYAFENSDALFEVYISQSVTSIGEMAFSEIYNLTKIQIEDGNPTYDSRDNCNAIIETVTDRLIFGTRSSTVPEGVQYIATNAFKNCIANSLVMPSTLIGIEEYAFSSGVYVTNLYKIDLSKCVNLTTIGTQAFYGCKGLTSIVIPQNVTTIGSEAFRGCEALFEVYNLSNLQLEAGVKAESCLCEYAKVVHTSLDATSKIVEIDNMMYYEESDTSLIALTPTMRLASRGISLDAKTTSIHRGAFRWAKTQSLDLSNCTNLKVIGINAFRDSLISSLIIPESVTKIGYMAFEGDYLTSLTFEGEGSWYRTIDETNWNNMTGGEKVTLGTDSENATNFNSVSEYKDYYWYKN